MMVWGLIPTCSLARTHARECIFGCTRKRFGSFGSKPTEQMQHQHHLYCTRVHFGCTEAENQIVTSAHFLVAPEIIYIATVNEP